jgi:hypothetical protein
MLAPGSASAASRWDKPCASLRWEGDSVDLACFARGAAYRRRRLIKKRLRLCCGGRKRLRVVLFGWGSGLTQQLKCIRSGCS